MKILALIAALVATPVAAQENCAPWEEVTQRLRMAYGEVPQVGGVAAGSMLAWFANPQTGSWTVVGIGSDGIACVLAAGTGYKVFVQGDPA